MHGTCAFGTLSPRFDRMLEKAATVYYVLAVIAGCGCTIGLAGRLAGRDFDTVVLFDLAVGAVVAYATAEGMLRRYRWAQWLGCLIGLALIFMFPVGTVLGVLVLLYLVRARRAGLFAARRAATT